MSSIKSDKLWTATESAEIWKQIKPPCKPSREVVRLIEAELGKKKKLNVLILGSTPEFRDMVNKHKWNSVVADLSWDRLVNFQVLMRYPSSNEIIIKADWTRLPLAEGCFDLILGDVIFSNLTYDKQIVLAKAISKLLKTKGVFILRSMHYFKPDRSLDYYVNKYLNNDYNLTGISTFEIIVKWFVYDFKRKRVENHKKLLLIKKTMGDNFSSKGLNKLLQIVPPAKKYWYSLPQPVFEKWICKYFRLKKIIYASDYPLADKFPVYVLKK